jgi:hypothetical protein
MFGRDLFSAQKHDFAATRAVKQRIHHELNRFCRRVQREEVVALTRLDGCAVIGPHIAAAPSMLSEFDIIGMPPHARLEDKHELVRGTISGFSTAWLATQC